MANFRTHTERDPLPTFDDVFKRKERELCIVLLSLLDRDSYKLKEEENKNQAVSNTFAATESMQVRLNATIFLAGDDSASIGKE